MQRVMRQRHSVSESQHIGVSCEWRRGLSVVVCESSVQHAVLRRGLCDGRLVCLVVVQRVVRSWHPDAESERVGWLVLWWLVMWWFDSESVMQFARVSCELHGECLV